jgi:hypothetical protein
MRSDKTTWSLVSLGATLCRGIGSNLSIFIMHAACWCCWSMASLSSAGRKNVHVRGEW